MNICQLTGKKALKGHKVSHSNVKTKRRFKPNLQTKRFYLATENRWVKMTISSHGLRIIDKLGIDAAFKKFNVDTATLKS